MITINNITKTFESKKGVFTALDNISLTIPTGEIFGIVGESGAGKSTLLRCIINLETPDSGEILIDNEILSTKTQNKTATVFQNYNLLSNKTAFDNVALPLRLTKTFSKERVHQVLAFVNLGSKDDYYPSQLSGGEKQRLAIARAIVSKPKYLICDEPTSALDRKTSADVMNLLQRINTELNTTILIVTHELEVAKALCSRVALLEEGMLLDVIDVSNSKDHQQAKSYLDHVNEVLK